MGRPGTSAVQQNLHIRWVDHQGADASIDLPKAQRADTFAPHGGIGRDQRQVKKSAKAATLLRHGLLEAISMHIPHELQSSIELPLRGRRAKQQAAPEKAHCGLLRDNSFRAQPLAQQRLVGVAAPKCIDGSHQASRNFIVLALHFQAPCRVQVGLELLLDFPVVARAELLARTLRSFFAVRFEALPQCSPLSVSHSIDLTGLVALEVVSNDFTHLSI
mmetsp:Transcript_105955/g.299551  ORF Transcript_105955/g.299551 Transcript_105955/m.299551 type:complete len:218 (-) Transcript_105955:245-898(-)